jgi:kynureninase
MAPDPLLRFRPEFPILETTTYLISNSLGAMPRGVAGHAFEAIDEIRASGAWERWTNRPAIVT